jgi:predicted dithiol-disulfide oxidoreductase (DUF899 family)
LDCGDAGPVIEREAIVVEQTRLKDSAEYSERREELRLAEVDLMLQREKVAALRRDLPVENPVDDYVFLEGPRDLARGDEPVTQVRLSELFSSPERPLVIYHLMFGKADTSPCPMCTMWIDGLNGDEHHIARNADFAIAAAAESQALRAYARERGWDRVRLLSCGDNTFKFDLASEDADGNQDSTISVFTLNADGSPSHFYTAHPSMSDEIRERGIDLLCPVWHLLDLTPQGRGDWYPSLDY